MLIVPTSAVPAQTLTITLANQPCTITILQRTTGMYLSLSVNAALIVGSVIGQNRNRIVRDAYLGFVGDLEFIDTQGTSDPYYTGLGPGGRFALAYLETADLA